MSASLADAADIDIALQHADALERAGLVPGAGSIRACARSAEITGELRDALRLLTNGYKYSTAVVGIARSALAKAGIES